MAAVAPNRSRRMPAGLQWAAALAAVAALAGYALLSHLLMVRAPGAPWVVAALFAPLLLALAAGGLKRRHLPTLLGCAAAVALLSAAVARGGADVNRLYVLQHAGIHLALAWTFGSTLQPGATPLITALAERVHTVFGPAQRAYTGRLTRVWAGYFIAMVLLSLALYAWAPWPWWSLFGNVLTPLSAAGLFVGEHLLRGVLHPEFERVSLTAAIGAYRARGAAAAGDAGAAATDTGAAATGAPVATAVTAAAPAVLGTPATSASMAKATTADGADTVGAGVPLVAAVPGIAAIPALPGSAGDIGAGGAAR